MDIDRILQTLNEHQVAYLMIGGMNFFLRHEPVVTFDLDIWIEDEPDSRRRCHNALVGLDAEWGPSDDRWGPVRDLPPDWLATQEMFCLLTPHGAVDIFRRVAGLGDWRTSFATSLQESTASGVPYRGICDEDMLRCQLALDEGLRKTDRVRTLRRSLQDGGNSNDP